MVTWEDTCDIDHDDEDADASFPDIHRIILNYVRVYVWRFVYRETWVYC